MENTFLFYSCDKHHKPEYFFYNYAKIKSLVVIKEELYKNSHTEKSGLLCTSSFYLEEIELKFTMLINILRE